MGMLLTRHYADKKTDKGATKEVAPIPTTPTSSISAEEIKAMSGAKLRKLAKENGVEDPEELTIGELKAVLIEKLG